MNILLVEDNQPDAILLQEFFSGRPNAPKVHWVTDGHDALDYIYQRFEYKTAELPDIILLDLGLPRISGYEVLRDVKKEAGYANIPVIILTTSCSSLDKSQCLALGADVVISKPQNLKEYEKLVERLLTEEFPRLTQPLPRTHQA